MQPISALIGNRYQLTQHLGSGGMGTVYQGIDTQTGQAVAIKNLKVDSADLIQRFIREGEALRQLNHPNIVKMLDAFSDNGQHYLVLELVTGGSLAGLLHQEKRLPIQRVLEIALDLSDALTRAHRLNIIHRDIKPDNVLLAEDGTPRLTDFGIARFGAGSNTDNDVVMGTLAYVSPEVLDGEPADTKADIWSFGAMLYEMVAGRRPFESEHISGVITAILTEPLPNLETLRPDVPIALLDLIYRMLVKNPQERLPSVRMVGMEVEALLQGRQDSSRFAKEDSTPTLVDFRRTTTNILKNHNLPHQPTPFIGREAELQEVAALLDKAPLVTITAPGGMGKTRLSIEAAMQQVAHFPNGVIFVELAPLTSAEGIPMAVAEAAHYQFQQDGRANAQQMIDYLSEKHLLLVLDNFEHVMEGRAFVQALLQAAPQVKILVTSRERLNLSSETLFHLSGMDFPEWETPAEALEYSAVKLFMQSASRIQPGFALALDDLKYVARICRQVYGMPLGILLAAAWLETLTLREIAEEIAQSLDFLETSMQDIPERQRSIRAVFDYSWNLLTAEEKQVLMKLAIFRGGMTRDAAQKVAGASLRSLQTLVNKSLLRRDAASGRYEIHELLRQYAGEQLGVQADQVRTAHSQYFLDLLHQRTADLKGHQQLTALDEIEADFGNMREAWAWAVQQKMASDLNKALESLYLFTQFRNHYVVGREMFRHARQQTYQTILDGRLQVRYPEDEDHPPYEAGLALARQYADPAEIAYCLMILGKWRSHRLNDQTAGIPMMEESIVLHEQLGDLFYAAEALDHLAWSASLTTDEAHRIAKAEESLALRRKIGDKIGTATALRNVGSGYFDSAPTKGVPYWEEARQIGLEVGDRANVAWGDILLSMGYFFTGDAEKSTVLAREAQQIAADIHLLTVLHLAQVLSAFHKSFTQPLEDKDVQLVQSIIPQLRDYVTQSVAHSALANDAVNKGDFAQARHHNLTAIKSDLPFSTSDATSLVLHFPVSAAILVQAGQPELAVEVLSRTVSVYPTNENHWTDRWVLIARLKAELQASLPTAVYEQAWSRGRVRSVGDTAQLVVQALSNTQGQ